MKNHFELNLPILKERFVNVLSLIENRISEDFSSITTRSGLTTGRYKSILLHSQFDPVKEGDQFARSSGISSGDYVLLYGLGLGYHLKPILNIIGSSGKLLVVELNKSIMFNAFSLINFTETFSNPNFGLVSGNNDKEVSENLNHIFLNEWNKQPKEKCKTLIHSPSFKCIPADFKKIQNTLELQLIEERTRFTWSEVEKHNYLMNKKYLKNGKGIKELKGKYKGKPAFLISAGPSLNRALPFLNKLSSMFYLVAVDTSLPVLLRSLIQPHYLFSIDPQERSFDHISNYLNENIPIILSPTASPKTVQNYSGEKYFVVQRNSDIDEIEIDELIKEKGESKGGGSVSCIALDVMLQMGFDPVIFVGQDCSFPGNRVYAKNTVADEIWIDLLDRNHNIEMLSCEMIKEKKEITIENKFGRSTRSHQNLYIYLRYLEQIIGTYSHVTFYNWLSMGAKIEGAIDIDSIKEIPLCGKLP